MAMRIRGQPKVIKFQSSLIPRGFRKVINRITLLLVKTRNYPVYDNLNRLTQIYRPLSATNSTLEYTSYTYQGRTTTIQDPKGYTTTRKSDVLGELLRVIDPDNSSTTSYTYDPFGHLTSITDPAGNPTTRTYDTLGYLLTGTSDRDRGIWVSQYDSLGELLNLRDAKTASPSWTQQLTYDALGRPLTRAETEGTTYWTWGSVAANHEIGRLTQLSGLGDIEGYSFDAYGRPSSHTETWNSTSYVVSYAYNNIGKLDTLTYPPTPLSGNPFKVKYGYTNGYLSSLQNYTGGTAGTTFWQLTPGTVNMDPWGHVVDETLGTTTAVRIQSAFDAVTSSIGTRQVGSGGSSNNLQSLAYQWDANGNLSQRQDLKQGLTEAIGSDNLNRFSYSTLNGTQNLAVYLDPMGNITSRVEGGVTYPYTYDTTHKHAVASVGTGGSQTTYGYDANGNMSTRNGSTITWSTYNLPTTINAAGGVYATFSYGPDRQRKQQTAYYSNAEGDNGTEATIYVGGLFEIETTLGQTHYKHFVQVPGGTQIIYDLQSTLGTQISYITADHLGSGNLLLNSAGATLINESYSAYGFRRSNNWSGPLPTNSNDYGTIASTTRRGYTEAFHEMLDNLNLIHMNGRVYDPAIGRMLSADPTVGTIGSSQSVNPYAYVINQPTVYIDPSGYRLQCETEDLSNPGTEIQLPDGTFQVIVGTHNSVTHCFDDGTSYGDPSWGGGRKNNGGGGGVDVQKVELPNEPLPKIPDPPKPPCPSGPMADAAKWLIGYGAFVQNVSTKTAGVGVVTVVAATPFVVGSGGINLPADAAAAAGTTLVGLGATGNAVGGYYQVFGGAVLWSMGDPQPMRAAMLNVASSRIDDLLKLPALPPGLADQKDNMTDQAINALVGPRNCSQH
jgi:RHS repeat-associated protein